MQSQILDNCNSFTNRWHYQWCISFKQIDQSLEQQGFTAGLVLTSSEIHRISRILEKQVDEHIRRKEDVNVDLMDLKLLRSNILRQREAPQQASREVSTETCELTRYNLEKALDKTNSKLKGLRKYKMKRQAKKVMNCIYSILVCGCSSGRE